MVAKKVTIETLSWQDGAKAVEWSCEGNPEFSMKEGKKADRGTVIRSAGSGKVVYSGWMGGYGKVLVIEHNNGQSTLYAHCSTLLVKQGESVSQSENVARVGTTGQSTGPHLHFEVRVSNSPVNPLKYLK